MPYPPYGAFLSGESPAPFEQGFYIRFEFVAEVELQAKFDAAMAGENLQPCVKCSKLVKAEHCFCYSCGSIFCDCHAAEHLCRDLVKRVNSARDRLRLSHSQADELLVAAQSAKAPWSCGPYAGSELGAIQTFLSNLGFKTSFLDRL
jgi:hypothetical protein